MLRYKFPNLIAEYDRKQTKDYFEVESKSNN